MDIEFNVNHQTIRQALETDNGPANKSQEYLHLKFNFKTDDWDNLTKFALFSKEGVKYRVAMNNDKALVPNAVLTGDRFSFSIYGLDNEDMRITTNRLLVNLNESGYTTDVENDLSDDDPTIVEQIYLDIDDAKSDAETYAKDYADTGLALKVDKTTYDAKVAELETGKSDVGHTHTESDITDLGNYSEVGHTHIKSDITDFSHTHDDRYYTEDEVDAIISTVKHDLLNRMNITSDKAIIQSGETADITARLIENGIPKNNTTIYFFEKIDTEE